MGKVHSLRMPPPRSREREDLAAAIARHQVAADRLARVNSAAEVLFVSDAQDKVEQAERALAKARAQESRRLIAHMVGEDPPDGLSVQSAQFHLENAQDELAQARRTREALDQQQREAESAVAYAHRAVRTAVESVVKAENGPERLLAQYNKARQEAARLHEILSRLGARNCLPEYWDTAPTAPRLWADSEWREVLTALEVNPDVPLPD